MAAVDSDGNRSDTRTTRRRRELEKHVFVSVIIIDIHTIIRIVFNITYGIRRNIFGHAPLLYYLLLATPAN
jgi:hypothetical protein